MSGGSRLGLCSMNPGEDDNRWENLQSDIRNLIYSYLFYFDRIQFHLTCKQWQLAIKTPIPRSGSMVELPWLMFFSNSRSNSISVDEIEFFHPISNQMYSMKIPELADSTFRCSKFGWLLMSRGECSVFFYNPFIPKCGNRIINLPDLDEDGFLKHLAGMSFSAPPTSPSCIVFAQHHFRLKIFTCRVGVGQENWSGYDIDYVDSFITSRNPPIFYQDAFYQLDIKGRLGVYHMNKLGIAPFGEDFMKPFEKFSYIFTMNYIVECQGEVVSVFFGHHGYPIYVFKLDWSEMKWVVLESLGNKAIFITENAGCLLVPANGTQKNKIYFPMFLNNKDGHQVNLFYSLQTRSYHAADTDLCWINCDVLGGLQNCIWIQPNENS